MESIEAEPRAASLIESLRDLGYSLETALADILDNSITASSSNIDILFEVGDGTPLIGILDDGSGMTRSRLLDAMRPGSTSPLVSREPSDLGRFGLGLKTASFSQCRKLTVATRAGGALVAARWDLDMVAADNKWLLQVLDTDEVSRVPWIDRLPASGTLVVWENLDRLVDQTSGHDLKDHLYDRLDSARRHLSLVFHRYLQGERPWRKVRLRINGSPVSPFDPFNSGNPATQQLQAERISIDGFAVEVQPFILPHHRKVSPAEYDRHAGDGGYLHNQGFYVYRNGRLIIHGTWFRLAKRTELTKLARVRVDMPSGLDHFWKIDVRKAAVQPPYAVKERLRAVIDRIAGASCRVYTSRGARVLDGDVVPFWVRRVDKNKLFYEINREHPLLRGFLQQLPVVNRGDFKNVLEMVETHFPTDAFFADTAGNPESIRHPILQDHVLRKAVDTYVDFMVTQGAANADIVASMARTDPYRENLDAVTSILREKGVLPDGD